MDIWDKLYEKAKSYLAPKVLTPFMEAGGVAAAILTDKGNIYVGVCIDTCSSLGMCAERNALASMITHGENRVEKLVCVMGDGRVGSPCGACREFMMQMHPDAGDIEILRDYDSRETVRLSELMPDWWGDERMREGKV